MRRESAYLDDALEALRELREFTVGTNREQFLASPLEQSYVYQRLVILGETMSRLAPSLKSKYPTVPWGLVIALRNRLVHGYFTLNQDLLWDICTNEIDETQRQLQSIKAIEFKDEQMEDE